MKKLETSWSQTKEALLWSLVTVCRLPPLFSYSHHTLACGVSSVQCLVLFAALLDRYCLQFCVCCCCCSGCFRCCPPCANCHGRFPLHVFCPQLLCQLLQDFPPGSPASGAPWMRCGHWFQPGWGRYRRLPLAIFPALTEYGLTIWSRMQTFFLGWHRVTSFQHLRVVNSSAGCFMKGGTPVFVCPWC